MFGKLLPRIYIDACLIEVVSHTLVVLVFIESLFAGEVQVLVVMGSFGPGPPL